MSDRRARGRRRPRGVLHLPLVRSTGRPLAPGTRDPAARRGGARARAPGALPAPARHRHRLRLHRRLVRGDGCRSMDGGQRVALRLVALVPRGAREQRRVTGGSPGTSAGSADRPRRSCRISSGTASRSSSSSTDPRRPASGRTCARPADPRAIRRASAGPPGGTLNAPWRRMRQGRTVASTMVDGSASGRSPPSSTRSTSRPNSATMSLTRHSAGLPGAVHARRQQRPAQPGDQLAQPRSRGYAQRQRPAARRRGAPG